MNASPGPRPDPSGRGSSRTHRTPAEIRERLVGRAVVLMLLAVTGWLFYVAYDALEQVEQLERALERAESPDEQVTGRPADGRLGLTTEGVRRLEAAGVEDADEAWIVSRIAGSWGTSPEERAGGSDLDADQLPAGTLVEEETVVLSDRWMLAVYEDDGRVGRALIRFRVERDGTLGWAFVAVDGAEGTDHSD